MALSGTEVLKVQGVDGAGHPSGQEFQTTTQAIADLGGGGTSPTYARRTITAAGAVTMTAADGIVEINKTVGAATTVNLPSSPTVGKMQIVKDVKGDAATNNITLTPPSGTIDGASTVVIGSNYGACTFYWDGTNFWVVA